jgi:ornithine cyclodeaminase
VAGHLQTQSPVPSADQITLYKSVGVAVQDAVAAQLVIEATVQQGAGREITL